MSHPIDEGALALSGALARREISCAEVMDETLSRLAARNPAVNAIVSLADPEELRAQARAADKAPRAGWLHGIPMAIKDLEDAAGFPTTKGARFLADAVAPADGLMVSRLRACGALIIGKTNTPDFGIGSHTVNALHGATRNPWDLDRSVGGSSGGAAAAIAAGILTVADGSDMMGSLRNPAGWTNIYGMRPSFGRVPATPRGEAFLHPLSTNGPMATNPSDLAALLDTMAGPVSGQPFCLPLDPSLPRLDTDPKGARVAWMADWGGGVPYEEGVLETCEAALAVFGDLGIAVEAPEPPMPASDLWQSWKDLRGFDKAGALRSYYENPAWRAQLPASAIWEFEYGSGLNLLDIERAGLARSEWYRAACALFERFDALILPTAQMWPFDVTIDYPRTIAGQALDTYHRWMEVVIPASLIGLPVVAVPAGFGPGGLPMGLQIIGAPGADARVLQLAHAWHRAAPWISRRPPVNPGFTP